MMRMFKLGGLVFLPEGNQWVCFVADTRIVVKRWGLGWMAHDESSRIASGQQRTREGAVRCLLRSLMPDAYARMKVVRALQHELPIC